MKLAKKHFRIAEILAMSFIGGCTEKETEEYVAWKQEDRRASCRERV